MFQLASSASSTENHFSLEIQIFCVNGTVFNRINCVAAGLLGGTWQIFVLENRRKFSHHTTDSKCLTLYLLLILCLAFFVV